MGVLCDNCNLGYRIEEYREKLNNIIVQKNYNLLDDEVINLSQLLDDLVYKCVSCNRKINELSKLNLKNVFGTHAILYYYGEQHLFVSLYFYIKEGIKNNEFIYVSIEENLYNRLIDFLKINKISTEHVKFKPVGELIRSNKKSGVPGLKETISSILWDNNKYNGVRWIGQPAYAIEAASQKDFLDMERNLNELVKNMNAAILCVYDTYDYMHGGSVINEAVIEESLSTHSHVLNNLVLGAFHNI